MIKTIQFVFFLFTEKNDGKITEEAGIQSLKSHWQQEQTFQEASAAYQL